MEFKVGQLWLTRGGEKARIINIVNSIIKITRGADGAVSDSLCDDGRYYNSKYMNREEHHHLDLLTLVDESEKFKVGQFWLNRDGDKAEIIEIQENGCIKIKFENNPTYYVLTKNGTYYTKLAGHHFDLISLLEETMLLEAGKSYRLKNGNKYTCLKIINNEPLGFATDTKNNFDYQLKLDNNGKYVHNPSCDVVAGWVDTIKLTVEKDVYVNAYYHKNSEKVSFGCVHYSYEEAEDSKDHSGNEYKVFLGTLKLSGSREFEV